jgi:Tfp pilus assembly protein PilO
VKDEVTIVLFPGTSGAPKKICMPKLVVKFGVLLSLVFLIGFLGSIFYFTQQYLSLQISETELVKLRRDSKIRKIQVAKLSSREHPETNNFAVLAEALEGWIHI